MFYDKYLDFDSLGELYQNYDIGYLKNIDENNFKKIYDLLEKYKFSYMEDIILRYLDIFLIDYTVVCERLGKLVKMLGNDYVDIIGENMVYLEYIIRD